MRAPFFRNPPNHLLSTVFLILAILNDVSGNIQEFLFGNYITLRILTIFAVLVSHFYFFILNPFNKPLAHFHLSFLLSWLVIWLFICFEFPVHSGYYSPHRRIAGKESLSTCDLHLYLIISFAVQIFSFMRSHSSIIFLNYYVKGFLIRKSFSITVSCRLLFFLLVVSGFQSSHKILNHLELIFSTGW